VLYSRVMIDTVEIVLTLLAFGVAVTTHLSIVVGLAGRSTLGRALVALVVVPLAPAWALRQRMKGRALVWMGGVVVYAAMRVIDLR
jgi:hypothetical protein